MANFDPIAEGATEIQGAGFNPESEGATLVNENNIQPSKPQSYLESFKNAVSGFLPQPQLPLGINVASGLMGSVMPQSQRNMIEQLPNAALNQQPTLTQNIATKFGETIPSLMVGEGSIPKTMLSAFGMGDVQAPQGQGLSSGLENALLVGGAGALGKAIPFGAKLLRKVDPEVTAKSIQNFHDSLDNSAVQGFENVSKEVNNRGLISVPINGNIFDQIVDNKYFPKSPKFNSLINSARTGDYNALRDLQSDLWTQGKKAMKSPLIAENNQGQEMFDVRDEINNAISNHLINTGNNDLAQLLSDSKYKYKLMQDTFYNKKINKAIPKLVDPEERLIPDNIMDVLKENSKPMNNLRNFLLNSNIGGTAISPVNVPADLNALLARQKLKNFMKGVGYGGAGIGALGTAYHFLKPAPHYSTTPTITQ